VRLSLLHRIWRRGRVLVGLGDGRYEGPPKSATGP
jgi:hypothetical protein